VATRIFYNYKIYKEIIKNGKLFCGIIICGDIDFLRRHELFQPGKYRAFFFGPGVRRKKFLAASGLRRKKPALKVKHRLLFFCLLVHI